VAAPTPLEELRLRSREQRERALRVAGDLDDKQLGWRPAAKAHSIAWTLWHIARSNDVFQSDLGGALVWAAGGYARRWGYPDEGVGTRMDDEVAAALPMPGRAELFGYVKAVFAAADAAVDRIDDARFAASHESAFIGGTASIGTAFVRSIVHDSRHLGEIEYIKGLQGLRGTATV
jgi:hypothetical protein